MEVTPLESSDILEPCHFLMHISEAFPGFKRLTFKEEVVPFLSSIHPTLWERLGLQDHGPFLQWFGTGLEMILFKQGLKKCRIDYTHNILYTCQYIINTPEKRSWKLFLCCFCLFCYFFFFPFFGDCFFARGPYFNQIGISVISEMPSFWIRGWCLGLLR